MGVSLTWKGLGPVLALAALSTVGSASAQPTGLSGLEENAAVFSDSEGVPHICSASERDAFFLQGYLHARDRFFQMDVLRRTFSGTLAELLGPSALASDIQFRTFGLRRAAIETQAALAAAGLNESTAALAAYSAGVNAYQQRNPLPQEYATLEQTRSAAWSAIDSLVISKGIAFGLSFDLLDLELTVAAQAYAAAGAAHGFDGLALMFEDVYRAAPFDPALSLPPALSTTGAGAVASGDRASLIAPDERTAHLARAYLERIRGIGSLDRVVRRDFTASGSNWWLLSGDKSATGHAMLANDPHQALDLPATFYPIGLATRPPASASGAGDARAGGSAGGCAGGGLNAAGVGFPGTPGLALGCNNAACWGATVNPMDVTDIYLEVLVVDPNTGIPNATLFEGRTEPLIQIPQTYFVNQLGDQIADNQVDAGIGPFEGGVTLVVPRRNHGPIIAIDASQQPVTALSVQYTGWRATTEVEAFRRFLGVASVEEFADALEYFDVGSQNWGYADTNGNIAYFTSAEMPIREDLQTLGFPDGGVPPFLIRDGTHTLKHEWLPVSNPQPGQSLGYEILPFAEMPQVVNPVSGYIVNANNDPIGTTLDNNPLNQLRPGGGVYYLSPGYADGLRIGRIDRLIEALISGGGKPSADDLEAVQANNQLLDAELLVPFVVDAFANASGGGTPAELAALAADPGVAEAVTRLMNWDFSTPTGIREGFDPGDDPANLPQPATKEIANSVAATIWSVFRAKMTKDVIDNALIGRGLGKFLPPSFLAYRAAAHHLRNFDTNRGIGVSGVEFWNQIPPLSPEASRDFILLANLRSALDLLAGDEFAPAFGSSTVQNDYRWGKLHRVVFDHPLGGPFNVPPAGGFNPLAPGLGGIARAGGYGAVDASSHSARADGLDEFMFGSGPARRFVGVLDPAGIKAEEILPGGQSGALGSPNYTNQLGRWLTNDYHPLLLSAADVAADVVTAQLFEPLREACRPSATALCLGGNRFRAEISWNASLLGAGAGQVVPGFSNASGNFYFFDPQNWEILVKVLDGCGFNDHYWVFASGATDLAWELTIEDTQSGETWSATNPLGQRSPAITDTSAFATCP